MRGLVTMCSTLKPLPTERIIDIEVEFYDDITPEQFKLPHFHEATPTGTTEVSRPANKSLVITVGQFETPFHGLNLKIQCEERKIDRSLLSKVGACSTRRRCFVRVNHQIGFATRQRRLRKQMMQLHWLFPMAVLGECQATSQGIRATERDFAESAGGPAGLPRSGQEDQKKDDEADGEETDQAQRQPIARTTDWCQARATHSVQPQHPGAVTDRRWC